MQCLKGFFEIIASYIKLLIWYLGLMTIHCFAIALFALVYQPLSQPK